VCIDLEYAVPAYPHGNGQNALGAKVRRQLFVK
jgi:hypothetical protein